MRIIILGDHEHEPTNPLHSTSAGCNNTTIGMDGWQIERCGSRRCIDGIPHADMEIDNNRIIQMSWSCHLCLQTSCAHTIIAYTPTPRHWFNGPAHRRMPALDAFADVFLRTRYRHGCMISHRHSLPGLSTQYLRTFATTRHVPRIVMRNVIVVSY